MSTVILYPAAGLNAPCDGYRLKSVVDTWPNVVASPTAETGSTTLQSILIVNSKSGSTFICSRGIIGFDTSVLGPTAIITAASLFLKVSAKNGAEAGWAVNIVSANPAAANNLIDPDYAAVGSTIFASALYVNLVLNSYYDFQLNANGLNFINVSGYTFFGVRGNWDMNITTPTTTNNVNFRSADRAGTIEDPYLLITYTLPSEGGGQYQMII